MMLAAITKAEAWAITEEESAKVAAAITNVTQFYEVPMLDEKGRAWLSLGMVGLEVYGSRVATAIMARKAKPKPAQAANVTPMRPQQQAQASPPPPPPKQPIAPLEEIPLEAIYGAQAGGPTYGAPA